MIRVVDPGWAPLPKTILCWQINQVDCWEEKSYWEMWLDLVAELLDLDLSRKYVVIVRKIVFPVLFG